MTDMARRQIREGAYSPASQPHNGLVLDRCLTLWPADPTKKGEAFAEFIASACKLPVSAAYNSAYARWKDQMERRKAENAAALWFGKVEGRLFLGTGGVSPLEAAITLHHTYGVPVLPGSALKGLARAYSEGRIASQALNVLFGVAPSKTGGGDAGYVIFHDAWWVPDGYPLVPEVVTVHHADYYQSQGGEPATDFDSPNPNPQIAVQGSFLFAVEGPQSWATLGLKLLKAALENWGAGAKTAAGYGYFTGDELDDDKSPEERLRAEIQKLDLGQLKHKLGGGGRQETRQEWNADWSFRIELIREIHGKAIEQAGWKSGDRPAKRAYKAIFESETHEGDTP
jgi:CRISPR-associated protein Cmr6